MAAGTSQARAAVPTSTKWVVAALLVVAADMLAGYWYLGQRIYLLNPVWYYLLFYSLLFAGYVYAAGRLIPLLPTALQRFTVLGILVFAVLFRLAVLPAPPSLTTDMYRYVWDGRLTIHGINPYHWAPNALTLRSFRDTLWDKMEYKPYQTIYMPVSQGVFALAYALCGASLTGYKALFVLFDIGVMLLILVLLRRLGLPPTQIVWYAWCPLPITEIALAGHQDIVGVFFLLLAFVLAMQPRLRDLSAVSLVAAALTKGFALLLIPLFCRTYGWRYTLVVVCAMLYLGMPLWVFLPEFLHGMKQYLSFVHVNAGLFHWTNMALTPITRYHYDVTTKLSDGAIVCVSLWAARSPARCFHEVLRRAFVVLAVTLLVVPTLFPWYLVWVLSLLPLLGGRPSPAFILLTGSVVLLYTFYISMVPYAWTSPAEYGPFYALLVWEYWRRRQARKPQSQKPPLEKNPDVTQRMTAQEVWQPATPGRLTL